jgi:diaminopimelate epimerase
MDPIDFYKYHALGNDYLVMDPARSDVTLSPERVRRICDRHSGVGADGILTGPHHDAGGIIRLRIFNPDGSEAEKSGNGIRIFARYLHEAGYVTTPEFQLRTAGGDVGVRLLDDHANRIEVDMGMPSFQSGDLHMSGHAREMVDEPLTVADEELRVTCVSMGNPHCVVLMPTAKEVSPERARRLGPMIERAPVFTHRTNVQLAHVVDERMIQVEIWERGAGYTLASGTSACAAAAAARRLGLVGDAVTVRMPGGTLDVTFPASGHVLLTGPVAGVARGHFHPDLPA